MSRACASVAYGFDFPTTFLVLLSGELGHEPPVQGWYGEKVEGVQALHRREACYFDPAPVVATGVHIGAAAVPPSDYSFAPPPNETSISQ